MQRDGFKGNVIQCFGFIYSNETYLTHELVFHIIMRAFISCIIDFTQAYLKPDWTYKSLKESVYTL